MFPKRIRDGTSLQSARSQVGGVASQPANPRAQGEEHGVAADGALQAAQGQRARLPGPAATWLRLRAPRARGVRWPPEMVGGMYLLVKSSTRATLSASQFGLSPVEDAHARILSLWP